MKYPSRAARALVLGSAAIAVTALGTRQLSSSDQVDQQTARIVAQMIPAFHLSQHPIDDKISTELVDGYIKELDPQKLYFLQSDIDQFQRFRTSLDDALQTGNVDFAYQAFDVWAKRATAQCKVADALKAVPGVGGVNVLLSAGEATVQYDEQLTSLEQLKAAVKDAGYRVDTADSPQKSQGKGGCCCR